MEKIYDELARYLIKKHSYNGEKRFFLGIAGVPGSGKSTLAKKLIEKINNLTKKQIAIMIPMDGFHYSKKELDAFPNVKEAHERRGAHWTFNAKKLLKLIEDLRNSNDDDDNDGKVKAPSFSHRIGDPIIDDITILPSQKILVFEGLYLHLSHPPIWKTIGEQMDELWFLQVEWEVARSRILERHIESGIAKNEEEALFRVENNDLLNAKYIMEHKLTPDRTINSIQEVEISDS